MRETKRPTVAGQQIVVEDREGGRWNVECLGDPVEVGERILFLPIGPESAGRGELVRVVAASRARWVCTLRRERSGIRLTPFGGLEAPELELADGDSKGAIDGTRVVVAPIPDRRATRKSAVGSTGARNRSRGIRVRVVEILGRPFEPESDHRALMWKHRLEAQISRRARLEVDEIDAGIPSAELERRLDLRHLPFVTIDPASARDHDDAVFAEAASATPVTLVDEGGRATAPSKRSPSWTWRLWVAIADVSYFVSRGGWVDAEARRRGNSFYFPDRAIPMLPERLSSDLCSLRPEVDRLAVVVELCVDRRGRVADALFHEAIIRSRARLDYGEAAGRLEAWRAESGPAMPADSASDPEWGASLRCLDAVTDRIAKTRFDEGAIALELPELEISVDEQGRPQDARLRTRNRAHRLIEEAMLSANRAVARALDRAERETIHRVHPPPSPSKLAALSSLLERLGIGEGADLEDRDALPEILREVEGTRFEERVNDAVLRSMSQARYAAESRGHFALRFEHYAHFTSPIRRYADLEVHRSLKTLIRGMPSKEDRSRGNESAAVRLAIWLSGRERVAAEVEREAQALACCSIVHGREGEHFDATVAAATEFGLFVRLDSPAVSGLVPMRVLDGEWRHDPDAETLVAKHSGKRIGLGDRLRVELLEVDSDRTRIAFKMIRTLEAPVGSEPRRHR